MSASDSNNDPSPEEKNVPLDLDLLCIGRLCRLPTVVRFWKNQIAYWRNLLQFQLWVCHARETLPSATTKGLPATITQRDAHYSISFKPRKKQTCIQQR